MSDDDDNLERNASMKTCLVFGRFYFFFFIFLFFFPLSFFFLMLLFIYLSILLPGNITWTNEIFYCEGIWAK